MSTALQRTLPNAITVARLVGSAAFFVVVAVGLRPDSPVDRALWGNTAVALFVLAAMSDWLDGYLARRWGVVTDFGRVMDPFVDKVLILGAFVYLASPKFAEPAWSQSWEVEPHNGAINCATGVASWMVVAVLARELLVTSLRGVLEARGMAFAADWSGKIKMVAQSVAVPFALLVAVNKPLLADAGWRTAQNAVVWATVAFTLWSVVPYIARAYRLMKQIAREGGTRAG